MESKRESKIILISRKSLTFQRNEISSGHVSDNITSPSSATSYLPATPRRPLNMKAAGSKAVYIQHGGWIDTSLGQG